MLRRQPTVLSLTQEDVADYEDRAVDRARAAEVEARQQAAESRALARNEASATAALRRARAALAATTPSAGSTSGRYITHSRNNGDGGNDIYGRRLPSSPSEHQFTDEDDDESEVETSYYARAQTQASRVVSFGRGQLSSPMGPSGPQIFRHDGTPHLHDDDHEERRVDEMGLFGVVPAGSRPPRQPLLSSSQQTTATTAVSATETPPNQQRDTRLENQPPPIQRRAPRDRTARPGPTQTEAVDAPPPAAPARITRPRGRGQAAAATNTTARQASTPSPPARETRVRGQQRQNLEQETTGEAAETSERDTPPPPLPPPVRETRFRAGGGGGVSRGGGAFVTPEARPAQRSREERIGAAAPRRGRSHQ